MLGLAVDHMEAESPRLPRVPLSSYGVFALDARFPQETMAWLEPGSEHHVHHRGSGAALLLS